MAEVHGTLCTIPPRNSNQYHKYVSECVIYWQCYSNVQVKQKRNVITLIHTFIWG
jgi:hypothetical protein